jgi:hypothetical protein
MNKWWGDKINTMSEAEMMAEVIAERIEASELQYHRDFGPGRITDIELNLEKIYET